MNMKLSKGAAGAAALAAVVGVLSAPTGCDRALTRGRKPPPGGVAGNGGGAAGNGGATTGATGGAAGAGGIAACDSTDAVPPKRIVRLSFNQIATAIGDLLGPEIGDLVSRQLEIDTGEVASARYVPPLGNPREGVVYTDNTWAAADRIAQRAAQAVLEGFASVTRCGDDPTVECGRAFLLDFAQRAYRRPLTADEGQSLLAVYEETRAVLGNVKEGVQNAVQAVLEAPEFLYRTELGSDGNRAGPLAPYELASALAFFLTNGPPDPELLDAAAGGRLATDAEVVAQATRLLGSDRVRQNLEAVMASYFSVPNIDQVVLDSTVVGFNLPRASLKGEAMRFLHDTLWGATIPDLLTSRRSRIDASLAGIYGVAFPPPGAILDQDGFAPVELPATRSGLLTQPAILVARARPSGGQIVGRGLTVRSSLLCGITPAADNVTDPAPPPPEGTDTQKANARIAMPLCGQCHAGFDPYGIALEHFDLIGRFRDVDEGGRPIDSSTVLPPLSGSAAVSDAVSLGRELVKGDRFVACLTQNLLVYALMAVESFSKATPESCANRALLATLGAGPVHFADLIRQITLSPAFRQRGAGGAP